MRTQARSGGRTVRPVFDEAYFERKAQSLVVPEEEIEAWELDAHDLDDLPGCSDCFDAPGSE